MRLWGMTTGNVLKPVIVDTDGHLQIDLKNISAGNNLIGRVDARDGDKIWSYDDVLSEYKIDTNANTDYNDLDGTIVPAGEVWKVTTITIRNSTSSTTRLTITAIINGVLPILNLVSPGVAGIYIFWNGQIYLKTGDRIRASFHGCTAGDDLVLIYAGYKMQI